LAACWPSFYSFDKVVHFILLGQLWGGAWLYMALVGHRHISAAAIPATRATAMGRAASEVGLTVTPAIAEFR
jgi:hypothetical protein